MNIENVKKIVARNNFWPAFSFVKDINECAHLINKPHEDYPRRVDKTVDMINFLTEEIMINKVVTEQMIRHVHYYIMDDLESRGSWRTINVHPSGGDKNTYFPIMLINDGMNDVLPIYIDLEINHDNFFTELSNWYTAFQTIHPFEDGNGRVGGVVVAAISIMLSTNYMTPRQ